MKIEFLSGGCPGRQAAQDHIKGVYNHIYGAEVTEFAPLLVVAKRLDGTILSAAGIRTAKNGFFSDAYLSSDFPTVLQDVTDINVPPSEIMEVVSLATTTPFPVLPMLDRIIEWAHENGKTCCVFTATKPLRRLLRRTPLTYVELAKADASLVPNSKSWGSYYDTDPMVCAFSEDLSKPAIMSPRAAKIVGESL